MQTGLPFDHDLQPPFYNDTHIQWRDALRAFLAAEIAPHVAAWDEAGDVPLAAHRKCAEFGLTGIGYPEQWGGGQDGIDIFHEIINAQEVGLLGAGGVGTALNTHLIGLPPVIAFGHRALIERVAPEVIAGNKIIALAITEPSAGSDVAAIQTRARRDGDVYIVNGSKTFISSGMKADFYTVAVRTGAQGASGLSLLLLDKGMPGFTATPLK